MSLTTRLVAGAAALTAAGSTFADGAQDYEARIAELEAQVARLTGDGWMTGERTAQIRDLVEDVLADADTRASLLQSGMTAGYDDGFMIGTSDGSFSLRLNGQLQTRYIWNIQDDAALDGDTNDRGFENTRTKLFFSGNVAGDEWTYYVEGNFSRSGGDFGLDDAYVAYDAGDGMKVVVGQYKLPLVREFLVHSMNQLAVERSLLASTFLGSSRTQGIMVDWSNDALRLRGSFNDGWGTANTAWSSTPTEYAFTGRADWLLSGNWDQFDDFTSPRGSEQGIMIGGGIHFEEAEFPNVGVGADTLLLTGDVSWEFDGGNVFGAIYYTDIDVTNATPIGFVVQGGYYFTDMWEGFVRYEWGDFDSPGIEDLSLITVGVNAYYNANVKMTADVGFGLDQVSAGSDITGWQADGGTDDGQVVIRTQLQLTF
jgi:hypothetical protein